MSKKHSNKSGRRQYFTRTLCYLIILLAITIITVFITLNPVTKLVNKIESYFSMSVNDIELDDSTYEPLSQETIDGISFHYGDKIAVISSDSFGLDCSVYYGSNRISLQNGSGLSGQTDLFGQNGTSMIKGYTQTYFSSLEYAQIDDVITIITNYGEFEYTVYDIEYIDENKEAYKDLESDSLVLCGINSDFSEHSGEELYVFCRLTKGAE